MKQHYRKVSNTLTKDKRDWFSAHSVALSKIKKELKVRGYSNITLHQIWRNVHGTMLKNGTTYFFKMASTEGISRALRNEVRWNRYFNQVLTPSQRKILTVPNVYTTGIIDGCFFYTSDFIDGEALGNQLRPIDPKHLSPWIKRIVNVWQIIGDTKPIRFVWDSPYVRVKNPERIFFKRAEGLYRALGSQDFLPLLDRARGVLQTYAPALNHGDMTPWHFLSRNDGSLCLIDAEVASSMLPKYYDLAFFFERLGAMSNSLDLAKEFLATFRDQLSSKGRIDFDKRLPPIVAERLLGGFWDATIGKNHASGRSIKPYQKAMAAYLKGDYY